MSIRSCLVAASAAVALSGRGVVDAARIGHEMEISMERRGGSFLFPDSGFDGIAQDFELSTNPEGVSNPLYENKGVRGENPLYNGGDKAGSPDDLFTVSSIFFEFDPIAWLHGEGIIHRDIATRNVLLASDAGGYSAAPGALLPTFVSDGPADYTSAPIVWTLDSDVTLFLNGDPANVDDAWILQAGSTMTAITVPAPAAASILVGILAAGRRRRN